MPCPSRLDVELGPGKGSSSDSNGPVAPLLVLDPTICQSWLLDGSSGRKPTFLTEQEFQNGRRAPPPCASLRRQVGN